jgi:DNA polymerase III subunit gamma/tau
MAFEVTATKFRPQKFDELIGQEFVATTLKNSIQHNKFANAYLLSGPRGCGKTSTARIIAKSLNCIEGPTITPCDKCENCISITSTNNTDVIEIDGASNTSINDVRTIQEEILYPPVNSKYKIYIIDEVHMLSNSAFNALLKTIEEPPPNVIFIFATTEINKVPTTIRSRCQQFNLRLIPIDLIYKSLVSVLTKSNVKFEEKAVQWIAIEGRGSMRDSYTLLDQVISFCDSNITMQTIQEKLGLVGEEKITNLVNYIISKDKELVLKNYFSLIESGISPEQIISELIKFFKNILIKKTNISSNKFLGISSNIYNEEMISNFSFEDIENIIEILFISYDKSKYSIDSQTEIEICLLKLIRYKEFIRSKDILESLEKIKIQILNGVATQEKKNPLEIFSENIIQKPQILPEQNNKPFIQQTQKIVKINVEKSEILKELKKNVSTNFPLMTALNNLASIEENGKTLTFYFSHQMYYDSALKNKDIIEKKIFEIIGKNYNINIIYNPELIQNKPKSIGEINTSRIKDIFNGKEIY